MKNFLISVFINQKYLETITKFEVILYFEKLKFLSKLVFEPIKIY